MSRESLIYVGWIPEEDWDLPKPDEGLDLREYLDDQVTDAVAEIEKEMGLTLKFHKVGVGRGASTVGTAVEIAESIAALGGAATTIAATTQLVKKTYHKIASKTGQRPMISLGAAEHLAMVDLTDRVDSSFGLLGSGDMRSNSVDRDFTGGDAFFVVLATESELHHYQVSAYGEVFYVGTSPPIRAHWDEPPPYWAGGDAPTAS